MGLCAGARPRTPKTMRAFPLLILLSPCSALVYSSIASRPRVTPSRAAVEMLSPPDFLTAATLIAEIVDADGERAYGAVDAPAWVLPVLAIGAISTSLLPILLSPGEEALDKMRENEGDLFGSGRELGSQNRRGRR